LEDFAIDPAENICSRHGSSTGGFTDCFCNAARCVFTAVDVNGRSDGVETAADHRVIRIERNARELRRQDIPTNRLVVVDVRLFPRKSIGSRIGIAKPGRTPRR